MKTTKWTYRLLAAIALVATVTLVQSCKDDEEDPTPLTLSTLKAGDIDLNGAASPTNVPTNPSIVAEFATTVDASTANATNIKLTRDYDDADVAINIVPDGNKITITPKDPLNSGALFELKITEGLKSDKGLPLTMVTRTFQTAGFFAPAGQAAYWPFEGNGDDAIGDYDAASSTDVTYVDSRNALAGKAASFNGSTSIMEVADADEFLNGNDFSISFWLKADGTNPHGNFVLGLGGAKGFQFEIPADWTWVKLASQYKQGDGTLDSEDNWWPGNGETKDNGGWKGWTFNKDVSAGGGVGAIFKDNWTHVICTYEASTKVATMYVNGEKVKQHDFNLWGAGEKKATITGVGYAGNPSPGNHLAFGFIQGAENRILSDGWADPSNPDNNHFKGLLDDVRIFKKALSQNEVTLVHNSEK